jgi:tRNA(Ile)-lysidine synthetase-like protein
MREPSCPLPEISGATLRLRAGRDPLASTLARSLRERCEFTGGTLLVAVSGGPDSVALLCLLAALAERSDAQLRIFAGHVDHGLRAESAAEAAFVRSLATAIGVPAGLREIDCPTGPGLPRRAREGRYEALRAEAVAVGADAVVTAHHGDDQLETLLMALGRGSGLEGLSAMAWARPLDRGIRLLRPLLGVSAAELRACCGRLGVPFCEDPGNRDPRALRGRLRTAVLPHLEECWPGAAGRAAGAADAARLGSLAVERWLDEAFGAVSGQAWPRSALRGLPSPLLSAGLRRSVAHADREAGAALDAGHLGIAAAAIADSTEAPRRWAWPRGWALEITVDAVRVEAPGSSRVGEPRPEQVADLVGPHGHAGDESVDDGQKHRRLDEPERP